MAYISKFKTDTAYSNADINEALSLIATKGILPDAPNDILSSLAESGVTYQNERLSVTWADEEKTQVKIGAGAAIMSDGSYIIIADEVLPILQGEKCFIYIYRDLVLQNIPRCSLSLPEKEDEYLLLAEVENGEISDRRTLSKSKIASFGACPRFETTLCISLGSDVIKKGTPFATASIGTGFSKLLILNEEQQYFGLYDLESRIFEIDYSYPQHYPKYGTAALSGGAHIDNITIEYIDGVLYFYSDRDLSLIIPTEHKIKLTAF